MRSVARTAADVIYNMRPHLREFLELCAQLLVCPEPIVEIGSFQVAGQEAIAELRPLFLGKRYIGCDMQMGTGVDRIEDIHNLSFESGEVGTFILADTLEHVADPIRAIEEIRRCLAVDGVAIFSSTMHFPIHGYPNDYWRFTPECFRSLAADFRFAATLFSGSPDFPHTVCGIAANASYPQDHIESVLAAAAGIATIAPLIVEKRARDIIHHLIGKLLPTTASDAPSTRVRGELQTIGEAGWYRVSGQWMAGWVADPEFSQIEIFAADRLIHRTILNRADPVLAAKLNLPDPSVPIAFRDQLDLRDSGDYMGSLCMIAINSAGEREVVYVSPPGLLLASLPADTAFVTHAFDVDGAVGGRRHAAQLATENVRSANGGKTQR